MTNINLYQEYLSKAKVRLKTLYIFRDEKDYSDVVRESQELVELLLKGLLRKISIDPPKWHDVSSILIENKENLPKKIQKHLERISRFSKYLRKERELSFYGEIDFLPSENYTLKEANKCISEVEWLFDLLKEELK